jgi:hypothetical protein
MSSINSDEIRSSQGTHKAPVVLIVEDGLPEQPRNACVKGVPNELQVPAPFFTIPQ